MGIMPHALSFCISFDKCNPLFFTTCHIEVTDSFLVNREKAACCAIFRAHIANCRTIGQSHMFKTRAEEFDEFADHAFFTQHLCYGQNKIGSCYAFLEFAGQTEADNLRQQHGNRLSKHCRFSFNTANAPAKNTQTIDHSGVGIGTNAGIRIGYRVAVFFSRPNTLGKVFKIDLMANAGPRGNNAEIPEGLLPPFQKPVAFAITFIFEFFIVLESQRIAKIVNDHRVINNKVDRNQRIDFFRIFTKFHHCVTHGCKIDNSGNAGKILHQNA